MNWEDSKSCTPLKRDFLRAWFAQENRFFLTGGSALGLFYLDHRLSFDLDLFTSEEVPGKEVQNLVQRAARQIGADCAGIQSAPDFHRFKLNRGAEQEIVDVVIDHAPQLDADKNEIDGIRVDTIREILANKLATLLSRNELKDVVDLYFLDQAGHNLLDAIPDAQKKVSGWEHAVVSMLLEGIRVGEMPEWMIRDLAPEDLKAFLRSLRLDIAARALPNS